MVQGKSVRLVTELALEDFFNSDVPAQVTALVNAGLDPIVATKVAAAIAADPGFAAAAVTAVTNAAAGMTLVKTTDPGIPKSVADLDNWAEVSLDQVSKIAEGIKNDGTKYIARLLADKINGVIHFSTVLSPDYAEVTLDSDNRIAEPYAIDPTGHTPTWVLRNYASRTGKALLGLAAFGDSMTAGLGGGGDTWPLTMSGLISVPVSNYGVSAQTSTEIALRSGALDVLITVTGRIIPASGPVAVSVYPDGTWRAGSTWTFSGTLAGVAGTLTKASDNTWTFTRTTAGDTVTVKPETRWKSSQTPGPLVGRVVWVGRNNVDPVINARDVRAIVTAARRMSAPIMVLPVFNGMFEPSGTSGYTSCMAVNAEYEKIAGSDFYDARRWMIKYGLEEAGITPTADDTADIAADIVPRSLMSDTSFHFNSAGYKALGRRLTQVATERGWFA